MIKSVSACMYERNNEFSYSYMSQNILAEARLEGLAAQSTVSLTAKGPEPSLNWYGLSL